MERGPRLEPGDLVGDYVVERFFKRGGMGALYVARDPRTGEAVALKRLDGAETSLGARFERECRIAERLRHPHIVAGRGHGRTRDGAAWFAMELLRGEDLEARLRRGRLETRDAVALAAQVCDALAYAHRQGVVHRDIKPANLFLVEGAALHVKVLDFGVARVADAPALTGTDVPVGTPSYMSPEQARGDRAIDPRSDVWSLGVVLYECLAGRRPFAAETLVGLFFEILEATPARLDAACRDVPARLADIVQQALEKPRERRTPSAEAMRAALDASAREVVAHDPSREGEPSAAGAHDDTAEADVEVRLVSVALVRGVRDLVAVDAAAQEFGGRVERVAGDGVVVLFGLPRWSGDERVRAASFARGVLPHAAAVSITTGRVLRGAVRVLGAAIDEAARRIGPDGITVDAATADGLRASMEVTPRPDGAYTLTAHPREGASRAAPAYDTPFVGREVELGLLLRSVERAWDEMRPAGVAVLGPAGIGKSRLRHEAERLLASRAPGASRVAVRCDPARRDAPFAALRESFAQWLDPSVDGVFDPPSTGADPTAALDRVRAALGDLLVALSERGPVVCVIDDVQWLDGASRAVLRWLREALPDLALVVWAFGRPDAPDALALAGAASVTELGPLDAHAASALLRHVAGEAPAVILERAGGHPLFLEELGQMLARRAPGERPEDLALPVSLEGAYLAQLDQMLPAEREFLKRAAVFGRTFWLEGVHALGGDPEAVARLRGARWVIPRARSRVASAREFSFRAGVLHEVALQLLPERLRARLHGLAARWLDARRGATDDELARHWELAGESSLAAASHARAAEAAALLADAATAGAHADRVLALTDDVDLRWRALIARDDALQLTEQVALSRAGLDALDALAVARGPRAQTEAAWRRCYFARVTYDRAGALDAGLRALALADALGDPRWRAAVNIDLAMVRAMDGALELASDHAAVARDAAARAGDAWLIARADATMAFVRSEAGRAAEGLALYERAAEGFAGAGDRRREALMRANAGWALLRLGRLDAAEAQMLAAIDAARRVGNAVTVASCTHNLGTLRRMRGEHDAAVSLQEEAEALAARRQNARLVGATLVERAYTSLARGARGPALDALTRRAVEAAESSRAPAGIASAHAVALRAGAAAADAVDVARARAAAVTDVEARAELLVAVWTAGPRATSDRDAARDAVAALLDRLAGPDDRDAVRDAIGRRFLVPDELFGA